MPLDGTLLTVPEEAGVMRCLITGASGFIGTALTRALHQTQDYQLKLVCRRLDRLPQAPLLEPFQIDRINGDTDWNVALENIEVVVHAAARVHVMQEAAHDAPSAFRRTNTEGTLRLAQQAADAGVRRFVFLSSIGVLGDGGETIYTEQSEPRPHTPYALSKYEAEVGLYELARRTGMEVVIVRPPLVYGAGAPGNFGRLSALVRRGVPLPLGAVRNIRSLVSLDNLVDFIKTCMLHPGAADQTFVVSDGEDLSTPELVRRMAQAMNCPARLVSVPLPVLRIGARLLGKQAMLQQLAGNLQISSAKAKDLLAWTAPYSVDASLRRTFQAPPYP